MFRIKPDKQLRATLTIFATMTGLWLLGVVALTLVPVSNGFRGSDSLVKFRHQATGATYAYQDATGQYTVYIRGTRRIGQISKTLERADYGGSGDGSKISAAGSSKREALKSAGLSTSAARMLIFTNSSAPYRPPASSP